MANPFLGRLIAQVVVIGGGIILKSAVDAFRQVRASGGFSVMAPHMRGLRPKPMTAEEAKEILGVKDEATPEDVAGTYNRMFTANDPQKGGSFYIQSKIFRAREALEREYGWNLEPLIPKADPEVTQDPPQNK